LQFFFSEDVSSLREDVTIQELSHIFFVKCSLTHEQSLKVARFIIEQPQNLQKEIEYDPHKTMMNRKIVKVP